METILVLILLLSPFVGFLINIFVGHRLSKTFPGCLASTAVLLSFIITLYFFTQLLITNQPMDIRLFDNLNLSALTVNIGFTVDRLSLLWLLMVTGIGFLIHVYSMGYMKGDPNIGRYFAYLNLFIFFMSVLVLSSNLFVMFIGWEGVGLCSYLLIGFWNTNHKYNDAAKKAFIMNRIGDFGFIIGIFTLAYLFKTIDFNGLKLAVSSSAGPQTATMLGIATFCLFVGAMGKSAQIPLYTWLPDAMAGPTPVSALIHAATMVTAGIFMVTRLNFVFDLTPDIQMFIAIIGAVTSLFAATVAIVQNDIKKVLAYSTVSQLGLMFLALGAGAYHIAVFHVITHAFFKACLFLGAGSVIHGMGGEQDMRHMGGLKKYMPTTYWTFAVSTLSISGIPFFAGFFSKDEIMITAFQYSIPLWVIAGLASLLTAFYMFRALYLTFHGTFRDSEEQMHHLHESPKTMTLPLMILGILAIIGGFISIPFANLSWLNAYLEPVLPGIALEDHLPLWLQCTMIAISILIALIGWFIAYNKYNRNNEVPASDDQITGFAKVLYHKYYIDEIYDRIFVKPLYAVGKFFNNFIEVLVGKFINGVGQLAEIISVPAQALQNGNLGFYLFCFVIGFCAIVISIILV